MSDAGGSLSVSSSSFRLFTLRTPHATTVGFADQEAARLVHGTAVACQAFLLELPHAVHLLIDATAEVARDGRRPAPIGETGGPDRSTARLPPSSG